jgi:hypothetical protein
MTGKLYYLTTLGDWQRHAPRFAQSHFIALEAPAPPADSSSIGAQPAMPAAPCAPLDPAAKILVLVEADEGAHLALEDDPAFAQLPHAFASKPISQAANNALSARLGLASPAFPPHATTFDAAEAAARIHPLLRPRVF